MACTSLSDEMRCCSFRIWVLKSSIRIIDQTIFILEDSLLQHVCKMAVWKGRSSHLLVARSRRAGTGAREYSPGRYGSVAKKQLRCVVKAPDTMGFGTGLFL